MKPLLLVLLVLASASAAEEPMKITLALKDTPAADAAKVIAALTNTKVVVDSPLAKNKVTLSLTDVTIREACAALAKEAGGDLLEAGTGRWLIAEKEDAWRAALAKKLDESKLTVQFQDTDIVECLAYTAKQCGVNIVLDPNALGKSRRGLNAVTIEVDDIELKSMLDLITMLKGLTWELRHGVVLVSTKERLAAMSKTFDWKKDPAVRIGMLTRMNLSFAETPVKDALNFISQMAKLKVTPVPATGVAPDEAMVDLQVKNLPARHVLPLMLGLGGISLRVSGGGVQVGLLPSESAEWMRKVGRKLHSQTVSFDLKETALSRVLTFIATSSGETVVLDPAVADRKITVKVSKVTLAEMLDTVTETHGLYYDLRYGAVFVSTKKRLDALPVNALSPAGKDIPDWEKKLRKRLRESKVAFQFDQATLNDALQFISTVHSVNIVIAPRARAAVAASMVTLSVTDMAMRDALALLLIPRGFRMTLKSEVILVDKAE